MLKNHLNPIMDDRFMTGAAVQVVFLSGENVKQ
jgi:hypothetical protein